ncbi:cytochrome b [Vibrio profundum]|uniref:cytochrome b n=1 Tax=Vibrio profundum TaxID=2910247 RepID=UPI003D0A3A30
MNNLVRNYNFTARLMHWVSAFVILAMFVVGLWMVDLDYYSQWYNLAPHWHRSVGILLAGLMLARYGWMLVTMSPKHEGKPIEILLARIVHKLMYLLTLVIVVSGYLLSTADGRGIDVFDWFTVPGAGELFAYQSDLAGQIHWYSALILIVFASLHALAAFKHHFIDKDNTLRKMVGRTK